MYQRFSSGLSGRNDLCNRSGRVKEENQNWILPWGFSGELLCRVCFLVTAWLLLSMSDATLFHSSFHAWILPQGPIACLSWTMHLFTMVDALLMFVQMKSCSFTCHHIHLTSTQLKKYSWCSNWNWNDTTFSQELHLTPSSSRISSHHSSPLH